MSTPPRRALQEFMAAQRAAGMLLCLCSKNNEEDVLETFRAHPEMPLRLERLRRAPHQLGVEGRSTWPTLADELSLGLDSFILVDDNPKECTEVQCALPRGAGAGAAADAAETSPRSCEHVWAFDRARVTEEDRSRAAMYAQQAERARLERPVGELRGVSGLAASWKCGSRPTTRGATAARGAAHAAHQPDERHRACGARRAKCGTRWPRAPSAWRSM